MTLFLSPDQTPQNSAPRIYDYLYSVENTEYHHPILQAIGWGYSTAEHTYNTPTFPEIPPWMAPDYPFVNPSEDIQGYVIDAYLSFDDPLHEFDVPIKMERITKHREGLYSVRFTDANGNVVFDSSAYTYTQDSIKVDGTTYTEKATNKRGDCVYKHYDWGWEQDDKTLYELLYWETELVTLKMTVRRTELPQFVLRPDSAELDARALYQYPDRVRSITIENLYDNDIDSSYGVSSDTVTGGHIQLWEKYNIKFEWEDNSDLRTSTVVTVSAIPGAGDGIAPASCQESDNHTPVSSINNTSATSTGDFFMKGDPCHSVIDLSVNNVCKPCCECQDMTDFGRLLNKIEDEYYCIGGQYKVAEDNYKKEVEDITNRAISTDEELEPPSIEYTVVKGTRLFAKFRFLFRNLWPTCVRNLTLSVSMTNMKTDPVYVSQSAPVAKDYADCLVLDYLPEAEIVVDDNSYVATWKEPIVTNQQVALKGLYRLNTTETSYASAITSITYEDDNGVVNSVDLSSFIHDSFFTYSDNHVHFEDFTDDDSLTDAELKDLTDSIRAKCLEDEVDTEVRRNTTTDDSTSI